MNMTQPKLWQCRRPRALPTLHRSQVRAGTCWDVKIGAPASTQEHLVRWSFRTDHGDDIGFEAFYIANAAVTASALRSAAPLDVLDGRMCVVITTAVGGDLTPTLRQFDRVYRYPDTYRCDTCHATTQHVCARQASDKVYRAHEPTLITESWSVPPRPGLLPASARDRPRHATARVQPSSRAAQII